MINNLTRKIWEEERNPVKTLKIAFLEKLKKKTKKLQCLPKSHITNLRGHQLPSYREIRIIQSAPLEGS